MEDMIKDLAILLQRKIFFHEIIIAKQDILKVNKWNCHLSSTCNFVLAE